MRRRREEEEANKNRRWLGKAFDSHLRIYIICCFVSLGGFMYGYDSGVITTVLAMPPFRVKYQLNPESGVGYSIVPVSLAASSLAAFLSGYFADSMGRKKFFILASVIHEVGCIVELAGQNHTAIVVGRMITGIGVGIFSMLVPLYQSEIAQPENRGRLITFYQILVTFGFFIAFWIGYASFGLNSEGAWLLPIGLQLGAGFLLLIGLWFIPESPRWLIYKGRNDEANEILARLRSYSHEDDIEVQMEFTGIVQDVTFDKMAYTQPFLSLLKKGTDNNRKRTLLGIGIHIFTQLSGINAILFYLPYILESAGIKEIYSVLLGNGVGGAVNFVATLFVLLYIDKWDRRFILVWGAVFMGVCMIIITIVSAIYNQQLVSRPNDDGSVQDVISVMSNSAATYVMLFLLCVFIAIFALSWGPVGWIYPAEIYPQMIRAQAMGITTFFSYLFNLFVSLASPVMFRNITWGTYLFFGMISLIMAVLVHKLYPETRGRSLEEIQLIFSGALIDQRPDAHHPATAAEALLHLEQIQHRDKRSQLLDRANSFAALKEAPSSVAAVSTNSSTGQHQKWPSDMTVSEPVNVSRALNHVFHQAKTTATGLTSHTDTIDLSKKRKNNNQVKDVVELQPTEQQHNSSALVNDTDKTTTADRNNGLNINMMNNRINSVGDSVLSVEPIPMEMISSTKTSASAETVTMSTIYENDTNTINTTKYSDQQHRASSSSTPHKISSTSLSNLQQQNPSSTTISNTNEQHIQQELQIPSIRLVESNSSEKHQ